MSKKVNFKSITLLPQNKRTREVEKEIFLKRVDKLMSIRQQFRCIPKEDIFDQQMPMVMKRNRTNHELPRRMKM